MHFMETTWRDYRRDHDYEDRAHRGYVAGERDADAGGGEYPRQVGDAEREQDEKPCPVSEVLGADAKRRGKANHGRRGANDKEPRRSVASRSHKEPMKQERYRNEDQSISHDPDGRPKLLRRV